MQIFVIVLLLLFLLYLVTGFSQPTIRVCLFCFCLHVFSIALHSYCCARLSCACVYLVIIIDLEGAGQPRPEAGHVLLCSNF